MQHGKMSFVKSPNHIIEVLDDSLTFSFGSNVTLVSNDEKCFKVHRIVLCASSKLLEDIFFECPREETTMIFSDVNGDILKSLVYYIYFGKVDLSSEKKKEFETLVKDLKIKEFQVETEPNEQHNIDLSVNPISHGVFDRDIIMGGGLKDPQPKTGLNLVRSFCKKHLVTRSLA